MNTGATNRLIPQDWLHPLPLERLFARKQPLEIDVGCGKGRFLLRRARRRPDINLLGIDRMLRRLRKVDRKCVRSGLSNIRLLRVEAYYGLRYLVPGNAVRACYVFFPDPWPKKRHYRHRLMGPATLDALYRILVPGGSVHLVTDHFPYLETVKHSVLQDWRFAEVTPYRRDELEATEFELLFKDSKPAGAFSFCRRR